MELKNYGHLVSVCTLDNDNIIVIAVISKTLDSYRLTYLGEHYQ